MIKWTPQSKTLFKWETTNEGDIYERTKRIFTKPFLTLV